MRLSLEHLSAARRAYLRFCWRLFLLVGAFPKRQPSAATIYIALRTMGGSIIAPLIRATASAWRVSAAVRPVFRGGRGVIAGAASGWIEAAAPNSWPARIIATAIMIATTIMTATATAIMITSMDPTVTMVVTMVVSFRPSIARP